ncbi:MAG TPA: ABC transporter substrate-binding protein, partial [Anaerolineales bacterium]|nr:ABC transporter substrate-binding protein [Anaerolineales bacterium]
MKRLALLTAALALTGCTPAGRVPTPTLQTIRLPMGYLPSVQFAPLYVADARGYFADEGLQVQFDYAFETDG